MKNTITCLIATLFSITSFAQTNPVPQGLPFSENFDDLVHSSTTWPLGFQGQRINNVGPSDTFFVVPADQDRGLTANADASSTGNDVYNFNQKLGFRSTSGGNNFMVLALNTLGYENIQFSYDIMSIRNLAGEDVENWIKEVGLQYRIGTSGDFTNIAGTLYQNPSDLIQIEGTDGQGIQNISVTLPEAVENQPIVQLRWVKREVSGSAGNNARPSFAIDNVTATGDEINLNTFYYAGSGDLNNVSNWSTNENGIGGSQPANFTNDDVEYIITNTAIVSLTSGWTVAGDNSLVTLGDGVVTTQLTVQAELNALVQVSNQASLRLENSLIPTFVAEEGSTLIFAGDATEIPYGNYHHLTLNNISPSFNGNGSIFISGDVVLEGTVAMPDARGADEYDVFFIGNQNQSIVTNGNVFRSYELSVEKTQGAFNLEGTISSDSQLNLNLSGDAIFNDNGNFIYAGNSVNIAGEELQYNLTGTLVLADVEAGIVNGAGDGNNFNIREGSNNNAVASFNNLIVRAVNEGGQFRFRDGSSDTLKIKQNFIIESQVLGGIRFYGNTIQIGGDFIVEDGFQGTFVNDVAKIVFNGLEPQGFDSQFMFNVDEVVVQNDVELASDLFVTEGVEFLEGKIFSNFDAGVYLTNKDGVIGADESKHFDGPFFLQISSTEQTTLEYPIGKDGAYRPTTLQLTQQLPNETWYYVGIINEEAPDFTLGSGITDVSTVRHYFVGAFGENAVSEGFITLTYGADDLVTNEQQLRIAKEEENTWINLEGEGDELPSGSITSTIPFTNLGFFTLATSTNMSVNQVIFEAVKVYPNPTKHSLTIDVPTELTGASLSLYDVRGNRILTQQVNQGMNPLTTENLANGLYILRITQQNSTYTYKVMKQ